MRVRNQRAYKKWYRVVEKSQIPATGLAILTIAENWAMVMERRLDTGSTVHQIAAETHQQTMGSNPKMALHTQWSDFLTDFLVECWEFGPALRKWYGPKKRLP